MKYSDIKKLTRSQIDSLLFFFFTSLLLFSQYLINFVYLGLINMEEYSEFLIQSKPDKHDRIRNCMAVIRLQNVDGLISSNYKLQGKDIK